MSSEGIPESALDRVRAAVAAAVALGLKKKAAILAKALPKINQARSEGFAHGQILEVIRDGGLSLTPAYYENLYAREMRKHKARSMVQETPPRPPVIERKDQPEFPARSGFSSSADELRRARNIGRQDFSKLIKHRKP